MQQNIVEQYQQDFQNMLRNEKISFEVSDKWYHAALMGLRYASPISLGVNPTEFKEIYQNLLNNTPLSCLHFAVVNNNLEKLSAHDLKMDITNYCELMGETGGYASIWNEQTQAFRQVLNEKIAAEQAELKKVNELHDKTNFMKPVKAEA
jgi:hypothetical protein